MKPIVGITIGDFNGVGPEVALKAIAQPGVRQLCQPVLIGPMAVFTDVARSLKIKVKLEKSTLSAYKASVIPVVDVGDGIAADVTYGSPTKSGGKNAGIAIERAVELCLQKKIHAMATAPTSKEALNLAGYSFPGQTEMVTLFSRSQHVAMMLVSPSMRVGLVTAHAPLQGVAPQMSQEKVIEKIQVVYQACQVDFAVKRPKLAVLALNPHAGEHGLIGSEEDAILAPAIASSKRDGMDVSGPFPADAFFGKRLDKKFDAILAMYHDQGLIPLKMSSFGKGVNYSAGLSIVRTSPDHGTAYDIAGKRKAKPSSMVEAIKLAVAIVKNRSKHD
ncbi:MAG: 4-hydroxythreonine-4-phosphate dehydrogenase PdxA [Ignavibacteriales bacterium]|nr:4-hydroxythreonine-4-phosphate dehydrogenase PdxA [Ignavibacteriales bacterium]